MHVIPAASFSYGDTPFIPTPEYTQYIEQSARTALENEMARLRGKGPTPETLLKVGVPWEDIIDAATRLDLGLIVMGAHGRRGLPRAILGSVAEKSFGYQRSRC